MDPASKDFLVFALENLLSIPSPSGYTDKIVSWSENILQGWGITTKRTRRGALLAYMEGESNFKTKAIGAHLDTLGVMVQRIKKNGRCALVPVGNWSSRFAEGCRVTLHAEKKNYRGTVLPLLSSGHAYNEGVDNQPVNWEQLELRVDEICTDKKDLENLGISPGDFVSVDPQLEILDNGFIVSKHLDNKAGAACLLEVIRQIKDSKEKLPYPVQFVFTVREELGDGASFAFPPEVSEFVAVDIGIQAPNHNSNEFGVVVGMGDSTGPYDHKLTNHLARLCQQKKLDYKKDVFKYYRSDLASSVNAGNDLCTALIGIGVDSSHGYERTHFQSLGMTCELIREYLFS